MMKQCVVFFMVCVVIMAEHPQNREEAKKVFKDCFSKAKPAKSDIQLMRSSRTEPITPEGNCFMGCIFEGWGIIDENGAFSQAVADELDTKMSKHRFAKTEMADQDLELAKSVNAKCASIVQPNKDYCVTGPAINKCLNDENKPRWYNFKG